MPTRVYIHQLAIRDGTLCLPTFVMIFSRGRTPKNECGNAKDTHSGTNDPEIISNIVLIDT